MEEVAGRWAASDLLVASAGISQRAALHGDEHSRSGATCTPSTWTASSWAPVTPSAPCGRRDAAESIVVVGSASGVRASAGAAAYCSSKAAVRRFVKAAALECAGTASDQRGRAGRRRHPHVV